MAKESGIGCLGVIVLALAFYGIGREDGKSGVYQSAFNEGYRKGKNEVRLISTQPATQPATQSMREKLSELEK